MSFNLFDEPGAEPSSPDWKVRAVLGSASMAFIFPSTAMDSVGLPGVYLLDGGTGWNNNMVSAVNYCRKKYGVEDSDISVDVISLDPINNLNPFPIGEPSSDKYKLDLFETPETGRIYYRNKVIKAHY